MPEVPTSPTFIINEHNPLSRFMLTCHFHFVYDVCMRNNFIEFKLETDVMGSHRLTWISKDGIELSLRISLENTAMVLRV